MGRIHAEGMAASIAAHACGPIALPADADQLAGMWEDSMRSCSDPRCHTIVALGRGDVVGFAALAPASPQIPHGHQLSGNVPTGELLALEVAVSRRGEGHEDRLVNAAAELARRSQFLRLFAWILPGDDWHTELFAGAGFAPAGISRKLAAGGETLTQHLWYTLLDTNEGDVS